VFREVGHSLDAGMFIRRVGGSWCLAYIVVQASPFNIRIIDKAGVEIHHSTMELLVCEPHLGVGGVDIITQTQSATDLQKQV
jgi:hypothetical protein